MIPREQQNQTLKMKFADSVFFNIFMTYNEEFNIFPAGISSIQFSTQNVLELFIQMAR